MSNHIRQGSIYGSAGRARSFSWSNILFRATWNTTWFLFAAWTPPQLYAWRRFLLNLFGAKIAPGARVYGSARIWYPPNLEMGRGAVLGFNVQCYCMDKIVLEDFAEVAQFVHLVAGTHNIDDPHFQLYTRPIRICRHAWLASGGFVGPGVTVGEGAVLGARGVAAKNLEPWTVYVGNPAKPIKTRYNFLKVTHGK
ncbi:putative colanic acid biosynthesis acetyltransferase [Hephaestia sp. GCM10023244]|uniref:putative colanic acid biosynthesis acetyltransferase n=1 Tax=unclassified Hephaestia TaxID=2631281 RepID=UPI0020774BFD|nr:putative colanic acid biosynthesis acetyltransferase [Hephaestia sp. MAHUQ-44]MCM8732537.1 putative colanic acid biosynthesis acetyltransferase [Hephaestia sp. MAHUQ-44]